MLVSPSENAQVAHLSPAVRLRHRQARRPALAQRVRCASALPRRRARRRASIAARGQQILRERLRRRHSCRQSDAESPSLARTHTETPPQCEEAFRGFRQLLGHLGGLARKPCHSISKPPPSAARPPLQITSQQLNSRAPPSSSGMWGVCGEASSSRTLGLRPTNLDGCGTETYATVASPVITDKRQTRREPGSA